MKSIRETVAPHVRRYCLDHYTGASLDGGILTYVRDMTGISPRDSKEDAVALLEEAEKQGFIAKANRLQYKLMIATSDKWPENWAQTPSTKSTGRVIKVQGDLSSGEITTTKTGE